MPPPPNAPAETPVNPTDDRPEIAHRLEPAGARELMRVGQLQHREPGRLREGQGFGRLAVDELGTELERDGCARIVQRENPAADPGPRLDDGDAQAGVGEIARRGKAG